MNGFLTGQIDISGWNKGAQAIVDKLGVKSVDVVRKESGELTKTLVRLTPPTDLQKSRKRIDDQTRGKFEQARDGEYAQRSSKVGEGEIDWYAWNENFLYGVSGENDMRTASDREIYIVAKSLTKKGRQKLAFEHPRKKQRVLISQRILVTKSQESRVVKKFQSHLGRLKAGWLAAFFNGVLKIVGANQPPQWVTRHASGVRGRYVDGLGVRDYPTFTIANSAKGIGSSLAQSVVVRALNIRGKAMVDNVQLYLRGKKKVSDYLK